MKFLFLFILAFSTSSVLCQDDSSAFDFWVGEWEVSWYDSDSNIIRGTNYIKKTLDDNVIQENFSDPSTAYKGTSISVYNPAYKSWHQAWADNQGGFYNFIGYVSEETRIFQTTQSDKLGMIFRMRFEKIEQDSFEWLWEGKKETAKEWNLQWKIDYKRK